MSTFINIQGVIIYMIFMHFSFLNIHEIKFGSDLIENVRAVKQLFSIPPSEYWLYQLLLLFKRNIVIHSSLERLKLLVFEFMLHQYGSFLVFTPHVHRQAGDM